MHSTSFYIFSIHCVHAPDHYVYTSGGLRLLGVPGWNLERGPISNEEEGGKRIF